MTDETHPRKEMGSGARTSRVVPFHFTDLTGGDPALSAVQTSICLDFRRNSCGIIQ